jgi:hypothetical protein
MKKYKNVVVSGCSFLVAAYPLEQHGRIDKCYDPELGDKNIPKLMDDGIQCDDHKLSILLANKITENNLNLECSHYNVAIPGASNELIIKRLYDWTKDRDISAVLDETLMIVGLSDINRFPLNVSPKTRAAKRMKERGMIDNIKVSVDMVELDGTFENLPEILGQTKGWNYDIPLEDLKRYLRTHYMYFYDDEDRIEKLNQDLELFQSYCNQHGIDVVFFFSLGHGMDYSSDNILERWSSKIVARKKSYLDNFNTENINYFEFPGGIRDWRNFIYSYDKTYEYGHPNIYDNVVLTELLYDFVEDMN